MTFFDMMMYAKTGTNAPGMSNFDKLKSHAFFDTETADDALKEDPEPGNYNAGDET